MAPRRRGRTAAAPASPRRRSRRLAAQPADDSRHGQPRGTSVLSTNIESSEAWPALAEAAKERISRYQPQTRRHEEMLQASLNAFVEWLPEGGRQFIARDIINATTDDELYAVFHSLLTGLAVPMKARTRMSSFGQSSTSHSSHAGRLESVETFVATSDKPETRDASFQTMCFRRDSYRCVVTGQMDTDHWKMLGSPKDIYSGRIGGTHIIPSVYATGRKSSGGPRDIASAWGVLWRCFPKVRRSGMQSEAINNPSNGLALRNYVHVEFGKFTFAFKATDSDNVYEIKVFPRYPTADKMFLPKTGRVRFTRAEDAQDLELPDADLLDCHYRLAEILNASGMAELIDHHLQDWDDIKDQDGCLREDGGTDIGQFLSIGLWAQAVS